MADVTIQIDEAAIDAMSRSWDSPVADIINAACERVEDYQKATAPVSPVGSKFSPIGHLRETIHIAEPTHYDTEGRILGLVGSGSSRRGGGYPVPLAFIANVAGITWNRGHKSTRSATNYFISESLNALDSFVYETG